MPKSHNERCVDCKANITNLLTKLYGTVESNWDLKLPSKLDDYKGSEGYEDLVKIHAALQNHRGFDVFVKSKSLPRVDYFVPSKNLIVEFDESQHFTAPRAIALAHYPENMLLGFSTTKWADLCAKLNKKDNDPPYRDEQRDQIWCSLDTNSDSDLEAFRQLIEE